MHISQGSVAFKMARALQAAGRKTALFVSPHVSCFRERMQVNGELIAEAEVVQHMEKVISHGMQQCSHRSRQVRLIDPL